MIEKPFYAKLNAISDWIIRIILINVLTIATSLLIVTFYPALLASYRLFKGYIREEDPPLFKQYFLELKNGFWHNVKLSILFIFIFGVSFWNLEYYLKDFDSLVSVIGYYATIMVIIVAYIIFNHSFSVLSVYPKIKTLLLFKIAFLLAGKFFFVTIGLMFIQSVPLMLVLLIHPLTGLAFLLTGVSLPMLLNAIITKKSVRYLEGLGQTNG